MQVAVPTPVDLSTPKLTVHPATGPLPSVNVTVPLSNTLVLPVDGVMVTVKVTGWLTAEELPVDEEDNFIVPPAGVTV